VRRLVIVVSFASIVTLPLWRLLAEPDVTLATELIADLPTGALPAVGLAFAIVNAGVEEAAFRGVLMDSLRSAVGVWGALVLQAAAFGLVHYAHGVPNGLIGAVISGIYGLALGLVRLRARGMLAPWIAHAVTDLAVFVLLVVWGR
jgi:membrane protease YdiL (CAAX protease family)